MKRLSPVWRDRILLYGLLLLTLIAINIGLRAYRARVQGPPTSQPSRAPSEVAASPQGWSAYGAAKG